MSKASHLPLPSKGSKPHESPPHWRAFGCQGFRALWQWSLNFGFNQGEVIEEATRHLYCAGQTSVDGDGNPQHPGDMKAQVALAADNVEAVLAEAGMSWANVVRLNMYTTDVDALLANYGELARRLQAAGVMPPGTLLGVSRLAFPDLMIELEATARA